MATNLQIDDNLNATAQIVKDDNGNESPLSLSTDAVGIGTIGPDAGLHVAGSHTPTNFGATPAGRGELLLQNTSNTDNNYNRIGFLNSAGGWDAYVLGKHIDADATDSSRQGELHFGTAGEDGVQSRMLIDQNGNVGIGTADPQTKLEVEGGDVQIEKSGSPKLFIWSRGNGTQRYSIRVTNNQDAAGGRKFVIRNEDQDRDELTIDPFGNIDVSGDIRLTGADCAEDFDVEEIQDLDPGTVMIIGDEDRLHQCKEAYDKRVAGVLSGAGEYRPGLVLDKQKLQNNRMPLALTGKVFCKVDAQYSPIGAGDLLTTSPTFGHAMKAADPFKAFGAVIGKALRPLAEGQGLIPILIALQ